MKLEELKKLCDEATPGPWKAAPDGVYTPEEYLDCFSTSGYSKPNAAFIAAAREALPKLIAVAEAASRLKTLALGYWTEPLDYDENDCPRPSNLEQALNALEKDV